MVTRPAQHDVQAWKASISIRSYQEAALAVSGGNARPPHLSKDEIMNLTTRPIKNVTSAQQSLTPLLCYACHTTLTSRGTRGGIATTPQPPPGQFPTQVLPLPMWVHNHIIDHDHGRIALQTTKLTEKEMKAEIEDFLLPDE
jgi:cytoplasmic tRNA 2-thiolation protein 2